MRIIGLLLVVFTLAFASGCAKINPQMDQKIDNQGGKIDEIKSNQNGVLLELGKLKQSAEIANSQLKEVQSGLLNLNAAISRNENSGVQILQGDGPLILIFGLGVIAMLLYHYRTKANKMEQAAQILAQEVMSLNDPNVNQNIIRAASFTESESEIYKLLKNKIFQ